MHSVRNVPCLVADELLLVNDLLRGIRLHHVSTHRHEPLSMRVLSSILIGIFSCLNDHIECASAAKLFSLYGVLGGLLDRI